ncbi:MAG: Lrp/AsnC ligand binding domain-containing protein, partial [Alphaproteobacteria bacterium]|nr:Lrp/AsnC ligand binding domain-containing protein [Alphaproteobacteria bacterium]
FVASREEIMECYSTSGDWDYELRVVVPDVAAYEHFLMRVLLHQPFIATAASRFALAQLKYQTALPV